MKNQWGMSNAEWGRARAASPHSPFPTPHFSSHSPFNIPHSLPARRAITLVELLVTMVIMAILAAAILGTASAAMEAGRRSRTQTTITNIHELLTERLASYETRRIPIHPDFQTSINQSFPATNPAKATDAGKATQDVRLLGLREQIKMEMPDRWLDVTEDPVILQNVPAVTKAYRLAYARMKPDPDLRRQNQGAECLYLVITLNTGDGEARTLFRPQDIGDTDNDGAQEFIDGWGRPISWLRWPSHFTRTTLVAGAGNADADHDPLDVYSRDQASATGPTTGFQSPSRNPTRNVQAILPPLILQLRDAYPAFRLVPLIYSAGPDGISDVNTEPEGTQGLNPYSKTVEVGATRDVNDDGDQNYLDNLHNHLIKY